MGIVHSSSRFFGCKTDEEGGGCSILSAILRGFRFLFHLVWRGKTENDLLPIHNTSREPLLAQSSDEGRRWQRDQQIEKQRDPDLVPPSPRCTSAFKSDEPKSEREIVDLLSYQRAYRDLVLSIAFPPTKTCNSNSNAGTGKNGDSTCPLQICNLSTKGLGWGMKKAQGNCPSIVSDAKSQIDVVGRGKERWIKYTSTFKSDDRKSERGIADLLYNQRNQWACRDLVPSIPSALTKTCNSNNNSDVGTGKNGDSTRPLQSCNSSSAPRNEGFGGMKKAQGNCPSTAKSQRSSTPIIDVVGGMKKAQGNCPSTAKSQRSSTPIIDVVGKERWIKHYSSRHRILLVGEGDFSFSASLALAFSSASNIIATSLNSQEFLEKNYSRAAPNIEKLRRSGSKVMHEIDATKMCIHPYLGGIKFDRIVFNFPHAGFFKDVSRDSQIRRHRKLVSQFLKNAREMISENGEIHISHKTNGFHKEWKVESIASSHKLRLIEAVPFNFLEYPGYNTKYGFGGDNNFNCNPSKTYKFGIKKIQYY